MVENFSYKKNILYKKIIARLSQAEIKIYLKNMNRRLFSTEKK